VLFGLLAVGVLIKKSDFIETVGVRGAFRSGCGAKLAHGFGQSMCNFRIDEFAACNREELRVDRCSRSLRGFVVVEFFGGY
jgi:hypothetical protein